MGKLPPSMRAAQLPLPFLKPSPSPSPSPRFIPKPNSKPNSKPKFKPKTQSKAEYPPPPTLFPSPHLPSAISAVTSFLSSPSPPSLNLLLKSYCNTSPSVSDSISFFQYLSQYLAPDRTAFNILLAHFSLSPSPDLSSLLQILNFMSDSSHPPNASSLDLSVRALCSNKLAPNLDIACSLLLQSPVSADQFTCNFLIRRLAQHRPISSVQSFIDQLSKNSSFKPDLVTYTILIDSVCHSGNLREATRLLSVLSESGFKPDTYLYNTIMKGHCMIDDCGGVMEVYNKMKDEGVKPDLVTYSTLVYGLSKSGMIDQAKRIFGVMSDSGHSPDVITYTSLMNGMCRKGNAIGALVLMREMEERRCNPNECTYNTLLMGLAKARFLDKAMEIYRVMVDKGMKLDGPTYDSFVRVLCRANRVSDAYQVFDYVIGSKSLNEVKAYTGLESSLKWLRRTKV